MPNIPKEILGQWLYDHFDAVIQRYSWQDVLNIYFKMEVWDKDKIFNNIKPWNEEAVDSWSKQFISNSTPVINGLVMYMKDNKTWPVPPIILENDRNLKMPNGVEITRYELIEGHHRYAYFKGLYLSGDFGVLKEHKIWLLKIHHKSDCIKFSHQFIPSNHRLKLTAHLSNILSARSLA